MCYNNTRQPPQPRPRRSNAVNPQKALATYLANYQCESRSLLWAFRLIAASYPIQRALYPGSHLHLTPSLTFPQVCYIDSAKNIAQAITHPAIRQHISAHKDYPQPPIIQCRQQDYRTLQPDPDNHPDEPYDLLISLNAGFISQHCHGSLKPGGLLLANNGHHDASRAQTDPRYQFIAALDHHQLNPDPSPYFRTRRNQPLTPEMVESDAQRPPSKARYRPTQEAQAYLFQRIP